jgi:NAD(P)-dependent dehydrogenase (short-subunit alcohol dehydrogenase family)
METLLSKPACYPDLRGGAAWVTGGGSGIGRGIVIRLAAEGMRVAICGRRKDRLDETLALVAAAGGECLAVPADVSKPEDIDRFAEAASARFGPPEALVHSAMLMWFPRFEEYTPELWDESFATGARAAYLLSAKALPGMTERGRGGIVFITSVLATRMNRTALAYCAAKGALEAMTRQMSLEFAERGIRVNAVAPGLILTWRPVTEKNMTHDMVPLRRPGTPAEMAAVVAFLLSHQSSYITGQVIHADGGTSVQLAPPGQSL